MAYIWRSYEVNSGADPVRNLCWPSARLRLNGHGAARAAQVSLSDAGRSASARGEIVRRRAAPARHGTERVTLRREGLDHDAHIQTIDEHEPQKQLAAGFEIDFHDSYRNNVAAYRIDRLLALGMAPVAVVRSYQDRAASFMWWVDYVSMDESARLKKKIHAPEPRPRKRHVLSALRTTIYNFAATWQPPDRAAGGSGVTTRGH